MKYPESHEPMHTITAASAWKPGATRPSSQRLRQCWRGAGNHARREIDSEDFRPKARAVRSSLIAGTRCFDRIPSDEWCDAHRADRKQIMKHDGKSELKPVCGDDVHDVRAFLSDAPDRLIRVRSGTS